MEISLSGHRHIGTGVDSFVYLSADKTSICKVYHEGTTEELVRAYHRRQSGYSQLLIDSGGSTFRTEEFPDSDTIRMSGDELFFDTKRIQINGQNVNTIILSILLLPQDAVSYGYIDRFSGNRIVSRLPFIPGYTFGELYSQYNGSYGDSKSLEGYMQVYSQVRNKLHGLGIVGMDGGYGKFSLDMCNVKLQGISKQGEAHVVVTDLGSRILDNMRGYS